ncbi:MAG: cation-translocating P-type ATPase [Terracidiphilus sp.]
MASALVPQETPAHALGAAEVISSYRTDPHDGLNTQEAVARMAVFGPNVLRQVAESPIWLRFLLQFRNVQVYLLCAAMAVSLLVWWIEHGRGLPYEALAILIILLLNALFGFLQEERASRALAALRRMTPAEASVIRDGSPQRIEAAKLVPGDLLVLREGDRIAADARLIEVAGLHTQESALTGESMPVLKSSEGMPLDCATADCRNMVFSGTIALSGHARAVVTATGMKTEFGRIASLLEETKSAETPLKKELDRLGKRLGIAIVLIAMVVVGTLVLMQGARDGATLLRILLFGVALAVAATPEGLPAVITVVLSIGVQRMARRGAIIRHLSAVETLGEATVIASDKTGTMTLNEMTARRIETASGQAVSTASGYRPSGAWTQADGKDLPPHLRDEVTHLLRAAALVNNATLQHREDVWTIQGDPTEGALLTAAAVAQVDLARLAEQFPCTGEIPFSSERKRMSTLHRCVDEQGGRLFAPFFLVTKGAADVLLERSTQEAAHGTVRPLTRERKEEILRMQDAMADKALRTLGVAMRALPGNPAMREGEEDAFEQELTFLGLIGMNDPPRPEAGDAVARAKAAGIRPILITGDHARTALAIAHDLGITTGDSVLTGRDLASMTDEELASQLRQVSVFARVDPAHKLRIVRALQRNGEVVAMTGDGVNDAPALKAADIGVAMGITGTDVAKEAADLVLTDDNFATIVAAIEEGRGLFDNIRKFLRYMLATNFGEILTLFLGVLLAAPLQRHTGEGFLLPLLAVQILWINLLTDGAPALALGLDPPGADIMDRAPTPAGARMIDAAMLQDIGIVAAVMAAGTLGIFFGSERGLGIGIIRTMAFTTLILFQLCNTLNARSHQLSAFTGLMQNKRLWVTLIVTLALQIVILQVPLFARSLDAAPLSPAQWLRCALVASSVLWVMEIVKMFRRTAANRAIAALHR